MVILLLLVIIVILCPSLLIVGPLAIFASGGLIAFMIKGWLIGMGLVVGACGIYAFATKPAKPVNGTRLIRERAKPHYMANWRD